MQKDEKKDKTYWASRPWSTISSGQRIDQSLLVSRVGFRASGVGVRGCIAEVRVSRWGVWRPAVQVDCLLQVVSKRTTLDVL